MQYVQLNVRIKAAVYDSILLIVFMYGITELFATKDNVSNTARIIAFICIVFLYEPLLVSIFGATIGHFFNDIVVKRDRTPLKNLPFHLAFIRFGIKFFLGWLSLITITGSEKRQAIHD